VAINGIENLQHPQPKVLVLQHIAIEPPGIFRSFLAQDSIAWDTVELDEHESIPALDDYAALWVMGVPMQPRLPGLAAASILNATPSA